MPAGGPARPRPGCRRSSGPSGGRTTVASMSNRSSRASAPSSPAPRTPPATKRASSTRRRWVSPGAGARRRVGRRPGSRAPPGGRRPRLAMARRSRGSRDVPRQGGQEGVRGRRLEDQVPVAPGPGRAAGVEAGRGRSRGAHHHGGLEQGVHGPHQSGHSPPGPRTSTWTTWPGGVDPGVGASGTGQLDRLAARRWRWQRPELAGHGALPGLGGEAPEAGAVVGDHAAAAAGSVVGPLLRGVGPPGRGIVDPAGTAAPGAAVRSGSNRVKPARCAPWARCRPGGARASGCGCSRRAGPSSGGAISSNSLWAMSLSRMRATTLRWRWTPPLTRRGDALLDHRAQGLRLGLGRHQRLGGDQGGHQVAEHGLLVGGVTTQSPAPPGRATHRRASVLDAERQAPLVEALDDLVEGLLTEVGDGQEVVARSARPARRWC